MDKFRGDSQERLHTLLGSLASRTPHKQVVMAVESGDGTYRWVGAAGEANPDGTPMRENTPFFIASIDKLLNTSIIMR